MIEGFIYYVLIAFLFFLFSTIAIIKDFYKSKIFVMILFIISLPVLYGSIVDILSRPRPVQIVPEIFLPDVEEANLLASHIKEKEYIMLLLNWDGLDYPRWWRYPWDKKMAEEVRQAERKGRENGETVVIILPFDRSLEKRQFPYAHAVPQYKTMPEKPNDEPEVLEFDHPSEKI